MKAKLTQRIVDSAKTTGGPLYLWDTMLTGFCLVVQPSGVRKFAIQYRLPGSRRSKRKTIGSAQRLDLAVARARAKELLAAVDLGKDPLKSVVTFRSLADAYFKREGSKLRTLERRRASLDRQIFPHIGDMKVESIKRSDIVRLLDTIEDEAGAVAADNALALVRRIFSWHESRHDDFRSPIVRSMNRSARAPRERTLTDDEIRKLWTADIGHPWSAFTKLLLLTGARRTELSAMRWDEVKDGVLTLPPERTKTKKTVVLPLSRAAVQILVSIPTLDGCPFVFTNNGSTPVTSFSGAKLAIDTASGVKNWRLHDLRRTARTLLARAGVRTEIAERALGHAVGGIEGVYNKHAYQDELRIAFERLAATIADIVDPPTGRVVPISG